MEIFLPYLVKLSGWLAAAFLFLNFLTCWVMPWARKYKQLLLKEEGLQEQPQPLCFYHQPLVWLAIIFTVIHIILAILV